MGGPSVGARVPRARQPLQVVGPPARIAIRRRAGRDLRDLQDLREAAGARLRAPPFARAKQMLPRPAIGLREARKPFSSAKHLPGTLPEVLEVPEVSAQAPSTRSGFAPSRPLARAFPARSGFALPQPLVRARLCGALCQVREHSPAIGARTGRALQNGFARRQWRIISLAIGRRAVAQAARHWQSVKPQAALPPACQSPAHAPRASRFAVRAPSARQCSAHARCSAVLPCAPPCAHHWPALGPPSARAGAQKAFTPAKGPAKGPPSGLKIFSTFFQNPLAHSPQMW